MLVKLWPVTQLMVPAQACISGEFLPMRWYLRPILAAIIGTILDYDAEHKGVKRACAGGVDYEIFRQSNGSSS